MIARTATFRLFRVRMNVNGASDAARANSPLRSFRSTEYRLFDRSANADGAACLILANE